MSVRGSKQQLRILDFLLLDSTEYRRTLQEGDYILRLPSDDPVYFWLARSNKL